MNPIDQAIIDQLGIAHVSAKFKSYPLYPQDQWSQFKLDKNILIEDTSMFLISPRHRINYVESDENYKEKSFQEFVTHYRSTSLEKIKEYYPLLQTLLDKYRGKLVLAGGALTNQFFPHDVDLYFINCTKDEMKSIVNYAGSIISRYYPDVFINIEEHAFLCNIIAPTEEIVNGGLANVIRPLIYQFIMKSYDSIGELLGSFDMFASQICYDGVNTWATDTGAWAYVNNIIVIDISRISNSFSKRINKYGLKLFNIVIPGLERFWTRVFLDMNNPAIPITDNMFSEILPGLAINESDARKTQISLQSLRVGIYLYRTVKDYVSPTKRLTIHDYVCGNNKLTAQEFYCNGHFLRKPCFLFDENIINLLLMARKKKGNAFSVAPRDIIHFIISKIPYV